MTLEICHHFLSLLVFTLLFLLELSFGESCVTVSCCGFLGEERLTGLLHRQDFVEDGGFIESLSRQSEFVLCAQQVFFFEVFEESFTTHKPLLALNLEQREEIGDHLVELLRVDG